MTSSLLFITFLGFTSWMSVANATQGLVSSCCPGWTNTLQRLPLANIVDYTKQSEGICPIKAIVFETKRGIRICSNPDSDRARKAMKMVDEEKIKKALQEMTQNEEGSTSTITPTVSSTLTNAPLRKDGRRKRQNKKNHKTN